MPNVEYQVMAGDHKQPLTAADMRELLPPGTNWTAEESSCPIISVRTRADAIGLRRAIAERHPGMEVRIYEQPLDDESGPWLDECEDNCVLDVDGVFVAKKHEHFAVVK